jgi:hypothetical protein
MGIPKFIWKHRTAKEAHYFHQYNQPGFITVGELCKRLGIGVFTKDRSQEITPIIQPDSAQRINRLPGVDYYRIEGTFALKTELMPKMASRHLSLTVTAGGHGLDIRFSHPRTAKITIFDARGRILGTLLNEIVPVGEFHRNVAIPFSRGIYFVRYRSKATTLVSHAIVIANQN